MEFDKTQDTSNSLEDKMKAEIEAFARAKEAEEQFGMAYETYKHLMSYEKRLGDFPEEDKADCNLVTKCLSTVYLTGEMQLGQVYFNATSDSAFVRGELGLVISLFQGMTPEELTSDETKKSYVDFCDELSEYVKISINRTQGLEGIFEKMVHIAKGITQEPQST